MAHPHSGDTLRRAALKSGYAAELREQRKVKKYGQQQSQSGTHTPCIRIPLVFEHFGFWGPMAEEYLDSISKKSKDVNGRNNEADFRDRWRKKLSIAIQSCVILKKLSKLSNCNFDDYVYDRDSALCSDLFVCFL